MRKIIATAVAAVALAVPAAAPAHLPNQFTSTNNATVACHNSYSGCQYATWNYENYYTAHPDIRVYFWRNHSDGRHKCYTGFRMNHNNVYVGQTTYECR